MADKPPSVSRPIVRRIGLTWSPLLLALSLLAIVSLSTACGGPATTSAAGSSSSPASSSAAEIEPLAATGDAAPTSSGSGGTLNVDLTEWGIKPDVPSIKAGTVQITATNKGAMEHELVIIKTATAANALPMAADGSEVDEEAAGTSPGELEDIAAGQSKSGSFTLTPGHYALICNQPGHYKQGMATDFTVN
ncbi:sulfocyanin-like copper-binding protein [Nitrolancea hollandica]|uniref:Sulfocyanin-like C-terminal domain-containing protein n=1 Tax=Nitrolancea hollandica Lb TaxID=1129897 RepID=I4ECX5_9BACT|nr:sulfocyanin-like copper-binding protein [Nitrolancea hollandica]CCF82537.1 conserved exported hypothetical protein [Nitrolancea hollandica Lb]